jgi:hypothetical protein
MELLLKNVDPKDFALLTELSQRLGIEIEAKTEVFYEKPDNATVAEDLKEAIEEIRLAQVGKINLRDARDIVNEL